MIKSLQREKSKRSYTLGLKVVEDEKFIGLTGLNLMDFIKFVEY